MCYCFILNSEIKYDGMSTSHSLNVIDNNFILTEYTEWAVTQTMSGHSGGLTIHPPVANFL